MEETKTIEEKLVEMQRELEYVKVANVADVMIYLKPLLTKYNLALALNDTVDCKGARYYVKSVARLIDPNCDRVIATTGETEHVDGSTKEASEIARFEALIGMFALS